jgi:hypothetical protein
MFRRLLRKPNGCSTDVQSGHTQVTKFGATLHVNTFLLFRRPHPPLCDARFSFLHQRLIDVAFGRATDPCKHIIEMNAPPPPLRTECVVNLPNQWFSANFSQSDLLSLIEVWHIGFSFLASQIVSFVFVSDFGYFETVVGLYESDLRLCLFCYLATI